MEFFRQIRDIGRIEFAYFQRFRRLALASMIVALIPALYTLIFLSSVWDPASHTQALSVALVNLDQGIDYKGQSFNIGAEVVARLKARQTFGFQDSTDPEAAHLAVRQGRLAFALVIPADFSSNAVPGSRPGAGRLVVHASEGNNYQSAHLARRFADDLGHAVNDSLNQRRWELFLSVAAGSTSKFERLRKGVDDLRSGAHEIAGGTAQTAKGASALSEGTSLLQTQMKKLGGGFAQLSGGVRTMDANRPKGADLQRLAVGAEALSDGHDQLDAGLAELKAGSNLLRMGVESFLTEANDSWLVPGRVIDGLDQVRVGVGRLDDGLTSAGDAQRQLADGAKELRGGVAVLTNGAQAFADGIHAIAERLPEDAAVKAMTNGVGQLAAGASTLAEGTQKVHDGMQRLTIGIDFMAASLPASTEHIEGSAEGLSHSVVPVIEVDAPVQNQGSSLAPNVIPASLWLGAGIIAFLVNVRVMPKQAETYFRFAQLLGKIAAPSAIAMIQAVLVMVTVQAVLGIAIIHPWAMMAVLVTASLTFLCIVFALTRALGDAGKALAMLFLAIQLSSSGGVLPVELSGGLFALISPWLPMTWTVTAIKACMFGAYGDSWSSPFMLIATVGVAAALCATLLGYWRYVDSKDVRPAVEF